MSNMPRHDIGRPRDPRRRASENVEVPPITMTREEVAKALQVTTKTVDNLWRQGKLPHPSRIGRGIRFLRNEIMRFIEEKKI